MPKSMAHKIEMGLAPAAGTKKPAPKKQKPAPKKKK